MNEYKIALSKFISGFNELASLLDSFNGDTSLTEKIREKAGEVTELRDLLLKAQRNAGLAEGTVFLEDNRYKGFRIEGGTIIGDQLTAYETANKYYEQFADHKCPSVFYEVAVFIYSKINVRECIRASLTQQKAQRLSA